AGWPPGGGCRRRRRRLARESHHQLHGGRRRELAAAARGTQGVRAPHGRRPAPRRHLRRRLMASIGTWPTSLKPTSARLTLQTNQRLNASPFGGSEQAIDMLNDRWMLSLTL